MDWRLLDGRRRRSRSAPARRRPEELVDELIAACRERFAIEVREVEVVKEDVSFKTPADPAAAGVVSALMRACS